MEKIEKLLQEAYQKGWEYGYHKSSDCETFKDWWGNTGEKESVAILKSAFEAGQRNWSNNELRENIQSDQEHENLK